MLSSHENENHIFSSSWKFPQAENDIGENI